MTRRNLHIDAYLSNAIKFTSEHGRVTIRIMPEGKDRFRLTVEDSGIGIRREDLHRLFVEFQQLDGGTSKRYGGTHSRIKRAAGQLGEISGGLRDGT